MKKKYMIPVVGVGALASVGVGYYLKNRNEGASTNESRNTLVNAGIPDQVDEYDLDQLENSKMVSEGSQYGVHYFNEVAEEKADELFERSTE